MKDTKKSSRRTLRLDSYDDLVAEAERLVSLDAQGTGNWTLGEAIDHVRIGIAMSVDGYTFDVPWFMKLMGRMMKNNAIKKGFSPGISPPDKFAKAFAPEPGIAADVSAGRLRADVERAKQAPEGRVNPMFGAMSNEQWEQFQCRHAELHFGFFDVS